MEKHFQKFNEYKNSKVLITGGLGFIGSNLAQQLVRIGANVTLVDSMLPLYGGNVFNLTGFEKKVKINFCDIRDRPAMDYLVRDQDFIFHLAGQVSHVDSVLDPFNDVDINILGTLNILESIRKFNPNTRLIFTGTRGQYGSSIKLPVDELAPTNPKGMYAITNLTAEKMILMYNEVHDIKGVSLRITNTYGPRHHMKHNRYGVVNWFLRLAMDDQEIPLMGTGEILRDYLFIDDLIEALLVVGLSDIVFGDIFNVGNGTGVTFLELAQTIISVTGKGKMNFVPFSAERKSLEPGDFVGDYSKIQKMTGWTSKVELIDGLKSTYEYYCKHRNHYWVPDYEE